MIKRKCLVGHSQTLLEWLTRRLNNFALGSSEGREKRGADRSATGYIAGTTLQPTPESDHFLTRL